MRQVLGKKLLIAGLSCANILNTNELKVRKFNKNSAISKGLETQIEKIFSLSVKCGTRSMLLFGFVGCAAKFFIICRIGVLL